MQSGLVPKTAKTPIVIIFGNTTWICPFDRCRLVATGYSSSGAQLLSIRRGARSLLVSAQIYDKIGDILAVIDGNRPHVNRNKLFGWDRPSVHELNLSDNHNDRVLHLDFMNPSTLLVEGVFYGKNHYGVDIKSGSLKYLRSGTLISVGEMSGVCGVVSEDATAVDFDDPLSI